jgi:hypothetical protein
MVEGTPTKTLTILGWRIDTRRLTIQLPVEKADSWDADLEALIQDGNKGELIKLKCLETIQGQNVHFS